MRPTRLFIQSLLLLLILSACATPGTVSPASPTAGLPSPTGVSDPGPDPTATPAITPVGFDLSSLKGVSLQVWHALAGPANDLFASQVALFNSSNEWGITVTATGYGDYPSLFDSVGTALGTAQAPQMVVALPDEALAWESTGNVIDLMPYIDDPALGLGKDVIADIPSVFWDQDSLDGKHLGLPAERSARFLFYNQTWAHELGFDNPPTNADEFRQQACAANASFLKDSDPKNDGYGGWIVDTGWQGTYAWMLAFGGGVTDGSAYGFRTDPNLAALQFIKGLYDSHCAWLSTEPTPFDSFARRSALFVSGDLGEVPTESESMTRLKNGDTWTVIPYPGPRESVVVAYGASYTVLKSTPNQQLAAWLFARWLLSPESQTQWVEATGLFPLRNASLAMTGNYQAAYPQWVAADEALSHAQGAPQLASWRKVRYVLEDGLSTVFLANTPANKLPAVLAQMDAMAQDLNK
ncbi:MAG TPA: extracellular solute-binding protein [Anaerolineales bacterium]|nr:extracellular solute-binding protein [Anaerolineales bacterium]